MSKPRLSMSECLRVADKAVADEYRAASASTPKPRAGEHYTADQTESPDDALRLCAIERDSLRERERELAEALEGLCSIVQYSVNRLDAETTQVQISGDLAVNLTIARAALAKVRP